MQAVTTYSPAKLNLFLELHARRDDGYHELETVMVAVNRYDRVEVRRREDSKIRVVARWAPSMAVWQQRLPGLDASVLQIPQGAGNLAYQAADRLREAIGSDCGFDIQLEKTIPAGAGMGGASSNAASVLRAVARLCDVPLHDPLLWSVGAQLGSDVPFFLGATRTPAGLPASPSRAALATGRGEQLRAIELSGMNPFVVAFPPQSLSTAAVYAACQVPPEPQASEPLRAAMAAGDAGLMTQHFFNRLAAPARQLSPWIDRLLAAMRALDLNGCQLTGSGSACFAMARSKRHAIRSVSRLAARGFQVSFFVSPLPLPSPLQ
ncbi:4-(cytidine 5'-diphospho)-2-C-methyl-D-erythritol kinase [Roseimaritima ulvae]|uniref:4-diphosphocytidyl-2-C-methyl-D-erythritol kinase n=1 Tax=Roseimaritima ulvae TaxID=980254 RepID=A0A5B9QST1_9BACT|nr:hypothetical protein [Roseimaritima ulvae]QEG42177.1 4-diphosphocytidyl-2-C-methyl-D-erythritol kinase [Roseimaritima ulvae]